MEYKRRRLTILEKILVAMAGLILVASPALAARTDDPWILRDGVHIGSPYDLLIDGFNHYINFNFDVGEPGYGFRDNSGTMEFKNDGGSWQAIGTGSGGGGSTPNLVYQLFSGTKYFTASSTADNLAFRFDDGFVSSASSSIAGLLTVQSVIAEPSGSPSTPSYAIVGDTDTGWYGDGAGAAAFTADGTNAFEFDSTNVHSFLKVNIDDLLDVDGAGTSTFAAGLTANHIATTKALTINGNGTSTFTGGIFANALRTNLPSCDSLDTDSTGAIVCGVDNAGSGSSDPNLIYRTISGTDYYTASSSATDGLAWHFADGFVSSGASSSISDILYLKGKTFASSSVFVDGATTLAGGLTLTCTGCVTDTNVADIALGGGTSGNYVRTIADAGNSTVTVSNSGTEDADVTLDVIDVNCSNCIDGTDIAFGSDATGDLTYYNGTDWARLGVGTRGNILSVTTGGIPGWIATSTMIAGFANDLICTDCINATEIEDIYILNNADDSTSGSLVIGGNATSTGLGLSSKLYSTFAGTSTFDGGIYANAFRTNLPDCDSLDTDSTGAIVCGTDAQGSGGSPNLVYQTFSGTKYFTASSSDNLAFRFDDGFVSSGASSSISDALQITGTATSSNNFGLTSKLYSSHAGTSTFDGGIASGSLVSNYIVGRNASNGLTLVGGTASGDDITLQSTENSTKGTLFLDDTVNLWTSFPDDAGSKFLLTFDATFEDGSTAGTNLQGFNFNPTYTNTGATAATQMSAVKGAGTYNYAVNPAFTNLFQLFVAQPSVRATGAGVVLNNWTILSQQDMRASAAITAGSTSGFIGFSENSLVGHLGTSGSIGFSSFTGFQFAPRMSTAAGGASTITTLRGLWVKDVSKAGAGTNTVTTQIGLDIEDLTGGVSNFAIRSQGTATSTHAGAFAVGTTTANYSGGLTLDGHLVLGGNTPTLSTCGTAPNVRGSDTAGVITLGTADPGACTLTFAKRWAKPPSCTANTNDTAGYNISISTTVTAITFTFPSGTQTNDEIRYICAGVE